MPSHGQKWLWQCWLNFCARIPKGSWGIVAGEIVTGTNMRDSRLLVHQEEDQVELGVEVVAPFVEQCDPIWILYGTEFHDHPSGKLARAVYTALRSTFPAKKIFAPQYEAWVPWNNELIHATHHQTVSHASSSRATYLNKSLIDMLVDAPVRGGVNPSIVVRAHAHQPGLLQLPIGISIGLGSWMLKSPYVWKVAPSAANVIGGATLRLNSEGQVEPCLVKYDLGKPKIENPLLHPRPKKSSQKSKPRTRMPKD